MSKKTVYAVMATLFLLSILTLKVNIQSVRAEPNTIIVPDDYEKIQWAIGNATTGSTIFVRIGTYFEHLVVNKPLTLVGESKKNTIVDGSGMGTVIKVTANNVVISGFTVQNSGSPPGTLYAGIWISGRACNLTGNHVTRNKIGVFVNSYKSRIAENIVTNNGQGIALYDSSEVTVKANNVTANTVGISLALSSNNVIVGNSATKSRPGGHGITLSSNSFNNTIFRNDLMNNYHGIWLSSSSNNWILENTIANNELLGIELASSSGNIIYHNNFINNPKHVVIDSKSICIWDDDYPSGGNYWDDYGKLDVDGDGVGDTPYVVNANNQDKYPLIVPRGPIPLFWDGMTYLVELRSNSTVSRFRFNASQRVISFNATGPDYTLGFCNITIPNSIVQDLWQGNYTVLVDDEPPLFIRNWTDTTNTYIYFTYQHSEHQVTIVPEFQSIMIPSILMLLITLAIITEKKLDNSSKSTFKSPILQL